MVRIGADLEGGLLRRLYVPRNPAGLWWALAIFAILFVLYLALQGLLTAAALQAVLGGEFGDTRALTKANMLAIFPASLPVVAAAWYLATIRGGRPAEVLNLRLPDLGAGGWLIVVAGFLAAMNAAIVVVVAALGIDLAQYTPGPHGESPESGSAGLVKEAMFDIANDPRLFVPALLSVGIGAPLIEELLFRGQLFTALSQTRLGISGTTVLTAAAWALTHVSEPWLAVGVFFLMGLGFGWLLYRFGSLWLTVACHAIWNTATSLIVFAAAGS
jgi:membrane protease YdiL (CAAX protease family)